VSRQFDKTLHSVNIHADTSDGGIIRRNTQILCKCRITSTVYHNIVSAAYRADDNVHCMSRLHVTWT